MKVIVRPPGEAFRRALSEHAGKDSIDPAAARRQHEAFVAALRNAPPPQTGVIEKQQYRLRQFPSRR